MIQIKNLQLTLTKEDRILFSNGGEMENYLARNLQAFLHEQGFGCEVDAISDNEEGEPEFLPEGEKESLDELPPTKAQQQGGRRGIFRRT